MERSHTPLGAERVNSVSRCARDAGAGSPYAPPARVLTKRQREVVALVAQGYTNQQIAEELVLAAGTVANHVEQILRRLNLDSRSQATAWAIEHGLSATQDRFLTTLERLLEIQEATLQAALSRAATLISQVLGADKVDAFLHEPETDTLVAVGVSATAMGHKQHLIGLDRQPVANSGRAVTVFLTGQTHADGRVDQDADELVGIKRGLGVQSQVGVLLEVGGKRRGVLLAQSVAADFFSARDLDFLQAVSQWVGGLIYRTELAEQVTATASEQVRRTAAEDLITVLAHDLGNHLTPLVMRQQLVQRQARRDGQPAYLHHADETLRGLQRLQGLIAELLDTARLEQGLFALQPEPVDLAALARATAARFTTEEIAVTVQAPAALPVCADPRRLRQALENLVANACQHSPRGAAVALAVRTEKRESVPRALVTVADQGPGIPAEVLPRIFERFTTGPNSTGLGLGLYLAQGIAAAHGGELTVQTSTGSGTRFSLAVPVTRTPQVPAVSGSPFATTLGDPMWLTSTVG